MAEKSNVKEIEADLKRMLNMTPGHVKNSSQSRTDLDIREDLSKMLDKASLNTKQKQTDEDIREIPKGMITNEDLENSYKKVGSSNEQEPKGKSKQKQKKKVRETAGGSLRKQQEVATVVPVHHQIDPPNVGMGQDQTSSTDSPTQKEKRKKKRKRRKKKSVEEDSNTDESEEDIRTNTSITLATNDGGLASQIKAIIASETKASSSSVTKASSTSESNSVPVTKTCNMSETAVPVVARPLIHKYLDMTLTQPVLDELEKERIFPLKKKSLKFPHAKYFCRLCDYHCDNVPVCRQHADDARHRRRKEIMIQDKKLQTLPVPSKVHIAALDRLIDNIYMTEGITLEQMEYREQLVQDLQAYLHQTLPDLQLRMYGSSLSGFGLKTSNLDIDLVVPSKQNSSQVLAKIYRLLRDSETYVDVNSNFMAKVPSVVFKSPCGEVKCQITVGTDMAYFTSRYLKIYSKMDPRVLKLACAFRYWARVCQLDVQENGSLPAYAYSLMTVYFLQQSSPPILPVIWKDLSEEALKRPKTVEDYMNMLDDLEKETWSSKSRLTVGELWREMLFYYGVKFDLKECIICIRSHRYLPRSEKKWKSKRIAIEDPFSCKRNIARSLTNTRIYDYFYNCLRKACVYFSLPTSNSNISHYMNTDLSPKRTPSTSTYQTQCAQPDQNVATECISIKQGDKNSTPSTTVEKQQINEKENKSNVIESEVKQKDTNRDVVESTEESSEGGILDHSFLSSCKHGSDVENTGLDECDSVSSDKPHTATNSSASDKVEDIDIDNGTVKQSSASTPTSQDSDSCSVPCPDKSENIDTVSQVHTREEEEEEDIMDVSVKDVDLDVKEEKLVARDCAESTEVVKTEVVSSVHTDNDVDVETSDGIPGDTGKTECEDKQVEDFKFLFTQDTLTDGKGPSIFCQICEKEGHLKAACPDDVLPDIIQLPPVTAQHISLLNSVIQQVPKDFKMSPREIKERESILRNLEYHVQETYPDAEMCLFGSSKNGFGFHQSDLDICVTFNGKKPEEIDFVAYIEAICKRLKSHRGLYNVFPITTAKVPIVKFKHRQSQLEGDISLYNILAQQNTRMLYTYSCVDPRVVTLVFAIKVFVKVCDIGDASKGSLSSYAYTLMMLHYLQHTKPPVLPVLQELQDGDEPLPEFLIEGWNSWFYDKLEALPTTWSGYRKNKQCTGELWLGFFKYYLEEFSFFERVISIRQSEPLTKFEKLWNGRCIAIEDPFDLSHNLGGALSRKMNQYILRTFVHARELYGTPISQTPAGFQTVQDYFFDQGQLTEGEPPSDRLCRVCNKIGHIAKECPKVQARKERDANHRKMQAEQMRGENERQAKQTGKDRPSSSRSLSEPSQRDHTPGKMKSQQYHRTHSYSNESSHDTRSGSSIHTPDKYARNASSSQQSHSPRYTPSRQDTSYNQHTGQGYYSANQYYSGNQRDNRGWRQIQSPSNMNYAGHSSAGPVQMNQGQRQYSSNSTRDFSPANQNQSCYSRTPHQSKGQQQQQQQQRQVHDLTLNSTVSGGQNYVTPTPLMYTNPAHVYVPFVMSTCAARLPPNMHANIGQQQHQQQPVVSSQISPMVDSNTALPQSWFPYHAGVPLYTNPAPVEEGDQAGVVGQGRMQSNHSRMVNVNKGSIPKTGLLPIPDVGITVKNEYFKGPEK